MAATRHAPANPPTPLHRPESLTWKPLRFLTLYRLTLAGLLAALFFMIPEAKGLGTRDPLLFALTSLGYLGFALVAGFTARLRQPGFGVQVFIQVLVDIIAIVLLMHAGGGLDSGLGILLVLAVATGAMLLPGRIAFFFAAVATVSIMIEFGLSVLQGPENTGDHLTRVGLLGITLFTAATIAHLLATRIRESEALAEQRGVDLANLSRLNEYVVQRLQSGILVVDEHERIHLVNDTAGVMLQAGRIRGGEHLEQICPKLAVQLRRWRTDPVFSPEIFTPDNSQAAIAARFTALGQTRAAATLIFLEDTAALAQQAQQMKLAALGRLTASIAHEIRNPLGAISHASQLLGESEHLDAGEQRLTEIIRNHTQRVNTIIENVLQLSRRGQSNPRDIVLVDWLHEFVDELLRCENIPADRAHIQVNVHGLSVQFDLGHLHQIVWNLTHNAIQHGGGKVELRVGMTEARLPCLEVLDEGAGISEDAEAHIFEPFFTTATSGTGLGLYLSRELCELNGAQLSYARRPEKGSRFRITFTRHSL